MAYQKYDIYCLNEKIGNIEIELNEYGIHSEKYKTDFLLSSNEIHKLFMTKAIPATRMNMYLINKLRGVPEYELRFHDFALVMAVLNYGVSLTDPIWYNPQEEVYYDGAIKQKITPTTYDAINFFDNDYPDDIGDILVSNPCKTFLCEPPKRYYSPDLTTGGDKNKRWKKIENENWLHKRYEWLYSDELKSMFDNKLKLYESSKEKGAIVPKIKLAEYGTLTSCIPQKGDFFFTSKQLKAIFRTQDLRDAIKEMINRFDAKYEKSDCEKISGVLLRNGIIKDCVW